MLSIFLDLETTGLDPAQHAPVEIAFVVVDMERGEERFVYESLIRQPFSVWEKRDFQSIEITGFTWEQLEKGKEMGEVGEEVVQIFSDLGVRREKAVFLCQNPSFDRGFFGQIVPVYRQQELGWPYHWLDFASMHWAFLAKEASTGRIAFPKELNLSKNAIGKELGIAPEEKPHRAMRGVRHLLACYRALIR